MDCKLINRLIYLVASGPMNAKTVDPHKPLRQDGEQSRERLLRVGLALFAQKGFDKTSTREIAEAAHTNIAAISYYFGDKAGLYRAVFFESQGAPTEDITRYANTGLSLKDALRALYASFLEPLRQGDMARQCMKLHAREMACGRKRSPPASARCTTPWSPCCAATSGSTRRTTTYTGSQCVSPGSASTCTWGATSPT